MNTSNENSTPSSPCVKPSPLNPLDPSLHPLRPAPSSPPSSSVCVVCMDTDKDITLAPCQHTHCCLTCFRRSQLKVCPVCRTTVTSITFLSTGLPLPLALVTPSLLPDRPNPSRSSTSTHHTGVHEPVLAELPRSLRTRRSMPSLVGPRDDDTASIHSRTTSMSSISVATQAQSSVRSLPREHHIAFRHIRQTGSAHPSLFSPPPHTRPHSATNTSTQDASNSRRPAAQTSSPILTGRVPHNIALIGHSRKILMPLAQRLLATFPPVDGADIASRSKSTLYINGKLFRIVLIECPMFSIGPELIMRVQRQSPKLVVLCADYFNISSFESIVRTDMEMLDYLNLTCVWVLVKSTTRPKGSNIVDDSDVRTASHFLSTSRKCFIAPVDGALQNVALRKFGFYLYRTLTQDSDTGLLRPNLGGNHSGIPFRSMNLFCLRPEKRKRRQREQHPSRSTTSLSKWLW